MTAELDHARTIWQKTDEREKLRSIKMHMPSLIDGLIETARAYGELGVHNSYQLLDMTLAEQINHDYEHSGQTASFSQTCFQNIAHIGELARDLNTTMYLLPVR